MAEEEAPATDQQEVKSEEGSLIYLDFVEITVQEVFGYASMVYDYAKENSGPLKPTVETIETTVNSVASPAIDKFQDVSGEVLKFVDHTVDSVLPEAVKDVTLQAKSLTTTLVSDVKNEGVVETAKGLYGKMEPVVEEYAASAWQTVNQVPLVTTMAKSVAPVASLVSSYIPLVPTETLSKVFALPESQPEEAPAEAPAEEPAAVAED